MSSRSGTGSLDIPLFFTRAEEGQAPTRHGQRQAQTQTTHNGINRNRRHCGGDCFCCARINVFYRQEAQSERRAAGGHVHRAIRQQRNRPHVHVAERHRRVYRADYRSCVGCAGSQQLPGAPRFANATFAGMDGRGVRADGSAFSVDELAQPETALSEGRSSYSATFANEAGARVRLAQTPLYIDGQQVGALYVQVPLSLFSMSRQLDMFDGRGYFMLFEVPPARCWCLPRAKPRRRCSSARRCTTSLTGRLSTASRPRTPMPRSQPKLPCSSCSRARGATFPRCATLWRTSRRGCSRPR